MLIKNKVGTRVIIEEDYLYERTYNALKKYAKEKGLYFSEKRLRELAKMYRDIDSLISDSEFRIVSRATIKHKPDLKDWEIIHAHNRMTCSPATWFMSILARPSSSIPTGGDCNNNAYVNLGPCGICASYTTSTPNPIIYTMLVGQDTSNPTFCTQTDLAVPIQVSPSSFSSSWGSGILGSTPGSGGQMFTQGTATWNAGVLPSTTIGEVGYMVGLLGGAANSALLDVTKLQHNQSLGTGCGSGLWAAINQNRLIARVAAADGAFTAFSYNNASPLTVSLYMYILV